MRQNVETSEHPANMCVDVVNIARSWQIKTSVLLLDQFLSEVHKPHVTL